MKYTSKSVVDIYRYARTGLNDKGIAKKLGISGPAFVLWQKKKASVRYALACGRKEWKKERELNWVEYVKGKLSPKQLKTWNTLTKYTSELNGYAKAKELLKGKSNKVRQELLIYALLTSGFSLSKALKTCGIERKTFLFWVENDPDFTDLINEVSEIQKDFFEESLMRLIRSGDSPATIFAARTKLRNRGYGEKVEVEHQHIHTHAVLPLGQLNLPVEMLRTLAEAVETREKKALNAAAIPIESKVLEPAVAEKD